VKRLLGVERSGGRILRDWLHTDASGREVITTEAVQDVEPIIREVKARSENPDRGAFRFRASIPFTLLEETCRLAAIDWGVKPREALAEVMRGKTDRSQRLLRVLTHGRDFRKLQAEKHGPRYIRQS
jgi:hypothetical protein